MSSAKTIGSTGRELKELGRKLQKSRSPRDKFKVAGRAAKVSEELIIKRSTGE